MGDKTDWKRGWEDLWWKTLFLQQNVQDVNCKKKKKKPFISSKIWISAQFTIWSTCLCLIHHILLPTSPRTPVSSLTLSSPSSLLHLSFGCHRPAQHPSFNCTADPRTLRCFILPLRSRDSWRSLLLARRGLFHDVKTSPMLLFPWRCVQHFYLQDRSVASKDANRHKKSSVTCRSLLPFMAEL